MNACDLKVCREKKGNGEDYSGFVKKLITLYSVKGLLCHIKVDV